MRVAVIIVLLVIGTVAFHFLSPWWMTEIASNWVDLDNALIITLAITGFFFVILNLFLAYSVYKFRHREGSKAAYEPENDALEGRLTFWTAIGIVIMLAPGLIAWNKYITVPEDAIVVEAVGQQWQWSFRFPGEDGVLGAVATEYIDQATNPFGLNPGDPWGADDILVAEGELHLPLDQPVKIVLRSNDVLHNFYVPQFRAKMDLVPGTFTYIWLTPTRTGEFEILCAEYCGKSHYNMRGLVVVEETPAFEEWLREFPRFGQTGADAPAATGAP